MYRMSHLELSLATQVQGVSFGVQPGFSCTGCPIWSSAWLLWYVVSHLEYGLASQVQGVPFGAQPGHSGTGCPICSKVWLLSYRVSIWSSACLPRYRVSHLEQSLASQVKGVPFGAKPGFSDTGCAIWSTVWHSNSCMTS
jgi:hypothetical protein